MKVAPVILMVSFITSCASTRGEVPEPLLGRWRSTVSKPVGRILQRIVADDISSAWLTYMKFAMLVVGVSGGVRVYDLERYVTPQNCGPNGSNTVLTLSSDRWILELYRTVIGALESIAWLLLVFFVVALVAYVIVRLAELRRSRANEGAQP